MTLRKKILKYQKLFVSINEYDIENFHTETIYCYFTINIASTFVKVSHVKCNIESGGSKLKADFSSFISTILSKMHNYNEQEDKNILSNNILFAR